VFTSHGSYASPQAYIDGLTPAMWVGVGVLAAGALIAAAFPFGKGAEIEVEGEQQIPQRLEIAGQAA
jgi:hypothetical protein